MKKHIKMPAELADKWLAALRSGEYKQTKGALQATRDGQVCHCCLGVLQMVADGECENDGVPSEEWLRDHGVAFFSRNKESQRAPFLPKLSMSASAANDSGKGFADIADAIEQTLERVP